MEPKPEGYINDFTAKCGHCDGFQLNGIHSHSSENRQKTVQNQNTTASVAMEMKYLHVGISNYAEILLVLTNHLSEIS